MELWDLYTKDREKTDKTILRGEEIPDNYYRLIIHVCIFNDKGEMLIQQRQPFKKGWPNMWDFSVGGCAKSGDTSQTAAEREVAEEIGINISLKDVRPSLTVHFNHGFDDIYLIEKNLELSELKLQYEEVQSVKWASIDEILKMIDDNSFIPYHKSLVELLFFLKNNKENGTRTRQDPSKIKN
jgi:isopentenyldiphosphate isomerase